MAAILALVKRVRRRAPRERTRMPEKRQPEWVSKTDLVRYLRCPYAFWLIDRGEISFEDTVDEFHTALLTGGIQFQEALEAAAQKLELPAGGLPELLRGAQTILGTPLFENFKLNIYGRPDGIDAANGALLPVEIKSHKDILRTDELELAFYWMLLEPYRTRRIRDRRGVLILRRNGIPERVEVPLLPHRFDEVRKLLQEVRFARKYGVRPRICGCAVCSGIRREEVHAAVRARKDLTLIFGIGREYAPALEELGLHGWDDLLTCDPELVWDGMKKRGFMVSVAEIQRWQRHAESWSSEQPIYFGGSYELGRAFIGLDLEYGPDPHVWLIGACVVQEGTRDYFSLWADSPEEEP